MLSSKELKENYGFVSDKPLSKRVADRMFDDKRKKDILNESLKTYAAQGGSKAVPIFGMIAGSSFDVASLVIGANLSATGFAASKTLRSYMGIKGSTLTGGAVFDSLEGFVGDYLYQKDEILRGDRDKINAYRVVGVGTMSTVLGSLGSLAVFNRTRPKSQDVVGGCAECY